MDQSISLNKFISDTGYCSRREADNLITAGRVLLNDQPAVLGNRYKPGDTVEVDGSLITAAAKEKRVYLALNKPMGVTTTTELHIKDNIISFVNYPKRIFPIGRLDKDSEGLIFLTNDGDIINKILRADNNHDKEYIVRVNKPVTNTFLQQMSQGVPILDTRTLPCKVQMMGRQTFRITLTQGLNRQIRRMCEHLGYAVTGLQRVRIMNIKLDKLPLGKWRYLSDAEVNLLKESVSGSSKVQSGKKGSVKNYKHNAAAASGEQAVEGETQKAAAGNTGNRKTAPGNTSDKKSPADYAKDKKVSSHKKFGAKPGADNHKLALGKPSGKSGKRDAAAQKTSKFRNDKNARPSKNAGKENQDNKKGKRSGVEGSFRNYRSKGRK